MSTNKENKNGFRSSIFHALSDPIRLEILSYLRDGEKCVCEIVPHLNLIQPLVSRHLKILKDVGIVRFRKDGTKRMYSVFDPRIHNVVDALNPDFVNTLKEEVTRQIMC